MAFQIFVKGLSGKTISINDVYRDTTVKEIKVKVQDKEAIPVEDQRLIFAGKELTEHLRGDTNLRQMTCEDYNLQRESTLFLVGRLKGGACRATVQLLWFQNVTVTFELTDTVQQFKAKVKSASPQVDPRYAAFRWVNGGSNLRLTPDTKKMQDIIGNKATVVIEEVKGKLKPGTHRLLKVTKEPCVVTWDDDEEDNRAEMPGCKHAVSAQGMAGTLRSAQGIYTIRCPGTQADNTPCPTEVPYGLAKAVAMSTPQECQVNEVKLSMAYVKQKMDVQECPHCKSMLCREANNKDIRTVCNTGCKSKTAAWCWYCKKPWTTNDRVTCGNMSCGANAATYLLQTCPLVDVPDWGAQAVQVPTNRRCAECKAVYVHERFADGNQSCKHARRHFNCNHEFCWVCLQKWPCSSQPDPCTVAPRQT